MKKRFLYVVFSVFCSLLFVNNVSANTYNYRIVNEKDIVLDNQAVKTDVFTDPADSYDFRAYGVRVTKSNVRTYNEWSPYRAVSDTVRASSAGASISTSRTTTFGTSVSGNISGLNIGVNSSVSSSVGYTLNIPGGRTAYLGFRVLYKVETGTRTESFYDGGVYRKNNYTVKTPIRGEYALIYR